jgi:hypothetical protein
MWKRRHNNSKAIINNRSGRTSDLAVFTLKNSRLLMNWVHFLNFFYFRRAQRVPAEKPSKLGHSELMAENEK